MSKFELRDGEISGKRGFVLEHDGYDQGRLCLPSASAMLAPIFFRHVLGKRAAKSDGIRRFQFQRFV